MASRPHPNPQKRGARRRFGLGSAPRARAGFSLAEVIMATFVMIFAISSCIIVLQGGFRAIDTARNTTLAAQIMQSEMERIRLLPWDTNSRDATGNLKPAVIRLPASERISLASIFPSGATTTQLGNRFTITRTVTDVPNRDNEMKTITVTITWTGIDGSRHTRTSSTEYSKNGLYDYYYTKADRRS
jgi:Tfp pilus assembly protein PilV